MQYAGGRACPDAEGIDVSFRWPACGVTSDVVLETGETSEVAYRQAPQHDGGAEDGL